MRNEPWGSAQCQRRFGFHCTCRVKHSRRRLPSLPSQGDRRNREQNNRTHRRERHHYNNHHALRKEGQQRLLLLLYKGRCCHLLVSCEHSGTTSCKCADTHLESWHFLQNYDCKQLNRNSNKKCAQKKKERSYTWPQPPYTRNGAS